MNIFDLPTLPCRAGACPRRDLPEELITVLAQQNNVKIERIVSCGQTTDWQEQEQSEFVVLVQGNAVLEFENSKKTLTQGDTLLIQPRQRHRVGFTSADPPCIWLCIFF